MIHEIRDYHYRSDLFEDYRAWAEKAVPVLRAHLDLVGFWIDSGREPELTGSDPAPSKHGPANVTWILRWRDMDERAARFRALFGSDDWKAVWREHPDPDGYLQQSARFMETM
jgi:hypothetical protein